jgi:hypothetical protein
MDNIVGAFPRGTFNFPTVRKLHQVNSFVSPAYMIATSFLQYTTLLAVSDGGADVPKNYGFFG